VAAYPATNSIIPLLVRPLVVLDDGPELAVVFLGHGLPELKALNLVAKSSNLILGLLKETGL